MEYRLLGASGLEVSALSFGTMTLGGEGRFAAIGNVQVEEARRQVEDLIRYPSISSRTATILVDLSMWGGRPRPMPLTFRSERIGCGC